MADARVRPSMRPRLLLAAPLLLVALLPTAPAAAPGPLRVAELLPVPDAAQGQREFVEVWNPTDHAVDLAGWKLRDAPTGSGSFNEFTFASGRLAANARIVVWSNGSADARGPSWSSSASKTVWNDAGDAVSLLDPSGTLADWFAYGNANGMAAPAGFESQAKPSAPAKGLSLALDNGAWSAGTPTPALAPGQSGGSVSANVVNVAPTVRMSGAPATAKPGQAFDLQLSISDSNGASDIASWSLLGNGATLAQGTAPPASALTVTAPAASGSWVLDLSATDQGGLSSHATATVSVRDARLSVTLAAGMLRFPDLRPGDRNVSALDWATLRNEGADAVTPLLDVSPFEGPAEIAVDGNLWVGLRSDTNATATWTRYGGALTALPTLAAGATVQMSLRLDAVPSPLAAGAYGTSFALVPA